MPQTNVDALPEELVLHIFNYLDTVPPSELKIRDEPSLDLTRSEKLTLKDLSRVSKRWRRVALPLLFKHARLRVDIPPREEWLTCSACGNGLSGTAKIVPVGSRNAEQCHMGMVRAFLRRSDAHEDTTSTAWGSSISTTRENFQRPDEASTAAWAWRLHHVLRDFCEFVVNENLASSIHSFVLFSDRMLAGKLGRFPHKSASREWRYPAAAAFWQQLLSIIDPERVVILAPPTELACLTNAAIDTFGDWAFGDMDFHILELRQNRYNPPNLTHPVEYSQLQPSPLRHPSFAPSSLLYLREWKDMGLNEGSFLRAYGTYEFFERGPPSLVYSIKQCLSPALHHSDGDGDGESSSTNTLPALRSFTYTAIFPFSNHADFRDMLPHLSNIDLQFAPAPLSKILDDRNRVGKAELSDCWQELLAAYYDLASSINTFRMTEARFPTLKTFICRDSQILELRTELDEIFTPLCLPVWVERAPGAFTREAMSAPIMGVGGLE